MACYSSGTLLIHKIYSMTVQVKSEQWQQELADCVTSLQELADLLDLPIENSESTGLVIQDFSLRVPKAFARRMQKGQLNDPLLRQVLPVEQEGRMVSGFSHDPLQEANSNPTSGVLHKYHGRVLVTLMGACAVHCRYCFRRHFAYDENVQGKASWPGIFDYIRSDNTITEVILSGGDPLTAKDSYLQEFIETLSEVEHVKTVRIHTRLPIVIPSRVTKNFLVSVMTTRLNVVMVVHANHANEIDGDVRSAFLRLKDSGMTLLNQSVLLRDVNDTPESLIALSESLFESGVLPYYLHILDPVSGTAHFAVSEDDAKKLMMKIRARLSGYLVPRLVRERAEALSKLPVS